MAVNPGGILDIGGNKILLAEVTDAWALKTLTLGTNAIDAGHLSSSGTGQQTSKTEFKSEDGKVRASTFEHTLNTTGILMQSDKATIDFFAESVKNKYFLEVKFQGVKDGKAQEIFKLGRVTPQYQINTPGGVTSMPYEFTGEYPGSTVTFNSTNLVAVETGTGGTIYATGVSITASQGFVVKETTV